MSMESGGVRSRKDSIRKDVSDVKRLKLDGVKTSLTRHNDNSSTMRTDIGKNKGPTVPVSGRIKEKSLLQVTMEAKKVELPVETIAKKRKTLSGLAYRALYKKQRSGLDDGVEMNGPDKLSRSRSDNNKKIGCEPMGKKEGVRDDCSRKGVVKLIEKSVDRASDGPPQKLTGSLKGHDANRSGNEMNVDRPHLMDSVVDNSERLPAHRSHTKNKDVESEHLPRVMTSRHDAINSESGEKLANQKVTEITPASAKCPNRILVGTCTLCSKKRRVSYDSPEMELCSCDCTLDKELGGSYTWKVESEEHHVNLKVEETFANEELYEIDNVIKEVQKKCDKRMKKLVRRQHEETKELNEKWEVKRLNLEKDHRVEMAVVRSIHGQCSEKLKVLVNDFTKKLEVHNLLKDVDLKGLEAKQIDAKIRERQKADNWLAEAKACCSSEARAVGGAQSLHSQFENDGGCSETNKHIEDQNPSKSVCVQANDVAQVKTSLGDGEKVCNEIRCVELNQKFPRKVIEIVPKETTDFVRPVKLSNSAKGDAIGSKETLVKWRERTAEIADGSLPVSGHITEASVASSDRCVRLPQQGPEDGKMALCLAEARACCSNELRDVGGRLSLRSQSEGDAGCSETSTHVKDQNPSTTVCVQANDAAQSDTSISGGERVCEQIRLVELEKEIPQKVHDIGTNESHVDYVCNLGLSNASNKGVAIGTDTLVKQRDGTDQATSEFLPSPEEPSPKEILEPSVDMPSRCVFSPQKVPQDEKASHCLAEKKACCSSELRSVGEARSLCSLSEGDVVCLETNTRTEDQNPSKIVCGQADDVAQPGTSRGDGETVCQETGTVEMEKETPHEIVPNENVDFVNPVEFGNASAEWGGSTDTAVNHKEGNEEAADGILALQGQILEPSASSDQCVLLPQQVPQDKIQQVLVVSEPKDKDGRTVENQNTILSEVPAPEPVDTVTNLPPNREAQSASQIEIVNSEHADTVTALRPSMGLEDQYVFLPQQVTQDDIFQTVEDQSSSRSEVPEPNDTGTTLRPHPEMQSASQIEFTTLECRDSPVIENQGTSQNSMDMSEPGDTVELPNQVPLQLGLDPTHQAASWNSQFLLEPLQSQLEKICKEMEQLQKSHEDVVSELKTKREKELAQIRDKYEKELQDAEGEFGLKKLELENSRNKVLLNKRLSECFRWICLDPLNSVLPGVHLGIPSSFMPRMQQLSVQHALPEGASARQPAPRPSSQMLRPNVPVYQHQSIPHSTGFYNVSSQNVAAPPVQVVQHAAHLFAGAPSRQPIISAISRAGTAGGRVGGDIRSAAPHLQSSRSTYLTSPHQLLPPAPRLPASSENRPGPLPPLLNPSQSALGLLMDIDHWAPIPGSHYSSVSPQIHANVGSSGVSHLETLGNVQGNMNFGIVGTEVVCLSDDEQ